MYIISFGVVEKGTGDSTHMQILVDGVRLEGIPSSKLFHFEPMRNGDVVPVAIRRAPVDHPEPDDKIAVVFGGAVGASGNIRLIPRGWGDPLEYANALQKALTGVRRRARRRARRKISRKARREERAGN